MASVAASVAVAASAASAASAAAPVSVAAFPVALLVVAGDAVAAPIFCVVDDGSMGLRCAGLEAHHVRAKVGVLLVERLLNVRRLLRVLEALCLRALGLLEGDPEYRVLGCG